MGAARERLRACEPAGRQRSRPAAAGARRGRWRRRSICTGSTATTRAPTPKRSRSAPGLHDAVLIAFARREQGLLVAPGNPLRSPTSPSVAAQRARLALRPHGAGAQLLLLALAGARRHRVRGARAGQAASARPGPISHRRCARARRLRHRHPRRGAAAGLDFVPLTWERFDLVLRQRDYFLPGPQALFEFLRTTAFRERAAELQGYDVSAAGKVRHVN